jgi:hypothetical protein
LAQGMKSAGPGWWYLLSFPCPIKEISIGHLIKKLWPARCWWLIPVILTTQEAEIRRIKGGSQPGQIVRLYLEKIHHKKGLVQWLNMWALSSNPSAQKKKICILKG